MLTLAAPVIIQNLSLADSCDLALDVFTISAYNQVVKFKWDEQKNKANIRKHGLDFADASQVFDGLMLVRLDTRQDYDEERWITIGMTKGRVVVIVYTEQDKGETICIISMRKALKHERKRYQETLKN